MVVRFVCVVCVPLCVRVFRVSRACVPAPPGVFLPVSSWCLFTGTGTGKFLILTRKHNAFLFRGLKRASQQQVGSQPLRALRARQRGARGEIAVVILLTHVQW